jgi:hypothetical protein
VAEYKLAVSAYQLEISVPRSLTPAAAIHNTFPEYHGILKIPGLYKVSKLYCAECYNGIKKSSVY